MDKKGGNRKKVIIGVGVVIAAALIIAVLAMMNRGNAATVSTYSVNDLNEYGYFSSGNSMNGTVVDEFSQNVTLREDYTLKRVHVREGQKVKKGDVLVTYDARRDELEMKLKEIEVLKRERDVEARESALRTLQNTGKDTYKETNNLPDSDADDDDAMLPKNEATWMEKAAESVTSFFYGSLDSRVLAEDTTSSDTDGQNADSSDSSGSDSDSKSDDSGSSDSSGDSSSGDSGDSSSGDSDSGDSGQSEDSGSGDSESESSSTEESGEETEAKVTLTTLVLKLTGEDVDTSCLAEDGKTLEVYIRQDDENADDASDSIDVTGKAVKDAIDIVLDGSKYTKVIFKRYVSQEDYENGGEPTATLEVQKGFVLLEDLTSDGKFSIEDIQNKSKTVTKSNASLTPASKSVKKGNAYNYKLKVDGTILSEKAVTVTWKIKGNKSKSTTINSKTGRLTIASGEKAKKIKIIATANGVKITKKVKVKKSSSSSTTSTSSSGSSSSSSGSSSSGTDIDSGEDYVYKGDELKEQISNREDELEDAKIELEEARIKYKELKNKVNSATVKASMNGTVVVAYSKNNLPESGRPIVVIKSGGGTYVQFDVNEMKLDIVKEGGTIYCEKQDYDEYYDDDETGSMGKTYEAKVTDIADYPSSTGNQTTDYWSDDDMAKNPNSSTYVVTGTIQEADGLKSGDSMKINFDSQSMGTEEDQPVIVMTPFIRQEGRRYYVYKVGSDNLLKKQYVQIGKTSYGFTQILAGLDEDDYIAFPYNKDDLDDAKTKKEEDASQIIETLYEAPEYVN